MPLQDVFQAALVKVGLLRLEQCAPRVFVEAF